MADDFLVNGHLLPLFLELKQLALAARVSDIDAV